MEPKYNLNNEAEISAVNQLFYDKITSEDPNMVKDAISAVNDFTRVKMREDGFWRKVLPPITISNEDLDRQVDTDKNVKVVDKQPESPGAINIPYGTLPMNRMIVGDRYRVMFQRLTTPNFVTDVGRLRTWHIDIRQVLADQAIKDMLAQEDGRAIAACNAAMVGQGMTVPETGTIQWRAFSGGITRETVNDALVILNQTPARLQTATVLVNTVFVKQLQKWGVMEAGPNIAEEVVKTGWTSETLLGTRLIVTIKRELVGDATMFMFAEPQYLGKFYLLEDTTMHVKREAYLLNFFAYEEIGSAIGNIAGVARADFSGTIQDLDIWRY